MWPFRQKTVQVEMKMEFALTKDGRSLSDYGECFQCHQLVNIAHTKVVEHHSGLDPGYTERRYCLKCAPEWDRVVTGTAWNDYRTCYLKRVPAVPETFEEVNLPGAELVPMTPMSRESALAFREALKVEKAAQKAANKAADKVRAKGSRPTPSAKLGPGARAKKPTK